MKGLDQAHPVRASAEGGHRALRPLGPAALRRRAA
jgi:hypothetical protein